MELSPHFTTAEMTRTAVRRFAEINAVLSPTEEASLRALCTTLLEPIRAHFGRPIFVHSGFRCPDLNAAIGGSKTSQHMKAEAVDFDIPGVPLTDVWAWIWKESGLAYGQCLLEGHVQGKPGWIHLSLGEPWRPAGKSRQHFKIEDA